jgi:hypothetical protein
LRLSGIADHLLDINGGAEELEFEQRAGRESKRQGKPTDETTLKTGTKRRTRRAWTGGLLIM